MALPGAKLEPMKIHGSVPGRLELEQTSLVGPSVSSVWVVTGTKGVVHTRHLIPAQSSVGLGEWPWECCSPGVCPAPFQRGRPGFGAPEWGLCVWYGVAPPHLWPDLTSVCVSVCVCVYAQLDKIEGVFERPSDEVIRELSRALRQALGVSLFGIDIIINNQTGQHAVIDINAFPGERRSQEPPSSVCRPVSSDAGSGRSG